MKCLDLKTGTEKWVVNGSYSWFTSPFFYNNTLYIHNRRERKVLGFSIDDGKKLNSYTLYDKTYTVPIITDKYMYFGEAKEYKCMRLE